MHVYEGSNVYYILIYSHDDTQAADTSAAPFTNESIALIVQVRLKRSGLEPLITSHEFSRVSFSLLFYTKPYQGGLLSSGARASDLYPFMREPPMSAAAFEGASHEDHCLLCKE